MFVTNHRTQTLSKLFCISMPARSVSGLLLALGCLGLFGPSCEAAGDRLRQWGERDRRPAQQRLDEVEVQRWQRDLNLSRARTLELHETLQELVQESNHRGMLAWKIAKAYLNAGRYDLAAMHYQGAAAGREPAQIAAETAPGVATFEQALPFFEEALLRHRAEPELLFEAGLCFANASRAAGWERERWNTAVRLFQQQLRIAPEDVRPRYQLALLYGKTDDSAVRDPERAMEYLRQVLAREERDISARFLLGQLLVEGGDLSSAREEYLRIQTTLGDLHEKGLVPGAARDNPRFQQARANFETLDACLSGGACAF